MSTPNIAPIVNTSAPYTVWNYNQIYTGPTGTGQYVPNVGDRVDWIQGNVITSFVVSAVNAGNMLSTLVELTTPVANDFTDLNVLFTPVVGNQPDTFLLYVDTSTVPYTANVDARLTVKGSLNTTAKVFYGSDLTPAGRVISATYDTSGNYIGENIGLELVASDALYNNVAIKSVMPFSTSASLVNGELVTIVFYNTTGVAVSKKTLSVINSAFIKSASANAKSVVGIGLITPFNSSTNSSQINYPLNLSLNVSNMTGVVYYSDGSSFSSAIDGTRFSISGQDSYVASTVGQSFPIVLKYSLQSNESGYGINNTNGPQISKVYNLVTTAPNLSYQTRLFVYPVWVGPTLGYNLQWFLYDMNRSQSTNVTDLITFASTSPQYNPLEYGTRQTLTAQINLANVNPSYSSFVYSQSVDILLESPGTFRQNSSTPPNWYVAAISGTNPMFGYGVFATFYNAGVNNNQVNLMGVFTTFTTWLTAYLANAEPPINTPTETTYPAPTHFTVTYGGVSTTYPITSWNTTLTLTQSMTTNDTLFISFFVRTTNADLQLAIAGVPLYAVSSTGAYL